MKKPLVLTAFSLAGILAFAGAHAATTDVTFAGKYTTANGTEQAVGDALDSANYNYTYTDYNGDEVTKNYTEEPDAADFKYKDAAGNWQAYDPEDTTNLPQQSDYTGTSTATGDVTTTKTTFAAGDTLNRSDYTYKNSAGEDVTLGESAPDFTQDVTLNSEFVSGDDATIAVKNGDAVAFDGTRYKYTDENGNTFHLNATGDQLLREDNTVAEAGTGTTLAEKFQNMKDAFTSDTTSVDAAKTATRNDYDAEKTRFDAANDIFNADNSKLEQLNNDYNTIAKAGEQWNTALANQESTSNAWTADNERQAAASDIFNAPITDTIDNRANDAIVASVADGGVIDAALRAGDEATLNSAKAYANERAALSLAAANAYTDKKIDKLDKDLSAGIASSVALSSVAVSGVERGEVSVGAGYGNYNSQSAVAFGAAMGLTNNWSVNVGAGISDADVAFRAGTNYKFKLF